MGVIEDFADLFEGRKDAYGTEEGGCVRATDDNEPFWFEDHLDGSDPIGVYPLVPYQQCDTDMGLAIDWRVKWGCVDFDVKTKGKPSYDYEDEDEAHVAACNLVLALQAFGITGWIERTRSYGRHVWVFAQTWVPAATMRRALLVACDVGGVSAREVNPKNEGFDDPSTLGNYVRLPYPGHPAIAHQFSHAMHTERTMIMAYPEHKKGDGIPLRSFVGSALENRATLAQLETAAALYKPPPAIEYKTLQPYTGGCDTPLSKLNRAGTAVFNNGPDDGDRSRGLSYLAYQARLSGLTQSEALALLDDAAHRWGKFEGRRDRMEQLSRMVARGYA